MTDSLTFIGRSLRHSVRSIDALLTAILLPVSILLMFVYVFGGAIDSRRPLRRLRRPGDHRALRGLRLGRHRGRRRAGHDHRRDRPLPHAADLVRGRAHRPRRRPASRATSSRPLLVLGVALLAGFRPVADPLNWLAVAGLLLALMTAISWLAACFGLLARSVEAANAVTFVAAFAPYCQQRLRPRRHDAGRPAVDRRPPARHADRRHAARADARHAGRQHGIVALAWCARGDRRRPRRRRVPLPAALISTRAAVLRVHARRRSAGSRSATSGSRARLPRGQARPRRTCSRRRARCAACSSTRRRSSRATTCSCSSAATARSTRRCSSSSPTSDRAAVRVLGARGLATCSARTCRSTATRCARRGGAWRTRMSAGGTARPTFRAHILERLAEEGPLRARDIEDRATVDWESSGWTHARNVARMLDLMWVRGQVGISRREGAQRVWDLMERCLPARRAGGGAERRGGHAPRGRRSRCARSAPAARRTSAPTSRAGATRSWRRCSRRSTRGRRRAHRGRGARRRLVDPRRGRRDARRRLPPRTALLSPVRQPALRPRAHRAAVRLLAPAGDLHAEGQAALGLLRAAGARRRPPRRPHRPGDGPQAQRRSSRTRSTPSRRSRAASGCRRRSGASSSGSPRGAAPAVEVRIAPDAWRPVLVS